MDVEAIDSRTELLQGVTVTSACCQDESLHLPDLLLAWVGGYLCS